MKRLNAIGHHAKPHIYRRENTFHRGKFKWCYDFGSSRGEGDTIAEAIRDWHFWDLFGGCF